MPGTQSVGSIIGYLRLDASDWSAEIKKAGAEADELGAHDPEISINVKGAAEALAKMTAVARAEGQVDDANERVRRGEVNLTNARRAGSATSERVQKAEYDLTKARRDSTIADMNLINVTNRAGESLKRYNDAQDGAKTKTDNTNQGMGALVKTALILGPALVPIAAGAAGLAIGFAGMGAAGLLAFVGIKQAMAQGSAMGDAYQQSMDDARSAVMGLAQVAASNFLRPMQGAVADLVQRTPLLTGAIGDLSTMTGRTAANLASGLLSGFIALEPLMRDVGVYVTQLSARFATLMSSGGVTSFGEYVQSVFPQVMSSIESIVELAVRLVAAFAPLGTGALAGVKLLADVLNAIPLDVLSSLVTLAGSVYIGFSTWKALTPNVESLTSTLRGFGASAEVAASGVRALEMAAGIVGVALAAFSLIMSSSSQASQQATQEANDYADALRQSNGAIDANVTAMAAKNLQDSGALDAARQLGLSLSDVTQAALGNVGAIERVNAAMAANGAAARTSTVANGVVIQRSNDLADAQDKVKAAIGGNNTALQSGIQKNRDMAAATAQTTAATTSAASASQVLAAKYGTTATVYDQVKASMNTAAEALAATTVKMQLQNDAAGLLKASLDQLSGKSLSVAQAQNAFDSALTNMGDHISSTGKKIHFTTTSINDMSSASVALRGQLIGQVTAAQSSAEAYGNMAKSSEVGRQKLIALRGQIINNAVAHGVDRAAVTAYVDSFMKIPKSIPPTKLDVDKAAAQAKAAQLKAGIEAALAPRKAALLAADTAVAMAKAAGLSAQIQSTLRARAAALLSVSTGAAMGAAGALSSAAADAARDRSGTITVTANTGQAVGAIANVQHLMAMVNGTVSTVTVQTRTIGASPMPGHALAGGGPIGFAGGGKLSGPGSGTSDSIAAVVRQTGQPVALSNGEFINTAASTRRNEAALTAGNKGATLQVAGQGGGAAPTVQVFIGNEEITGRVRVVVQNEMQSQARSQVIADRQMNGVSR